MRTLSNETREMVEQLTLARRRSLLDAASVRELIGLIADTRTPVLAAHLLPFAFSEDTETAQAAAGAIRRLISALAPRDYVRLDVDIRQVYNSYKWDWRLAPALVEMFNRSYAVPTPAQIQSIDAALQQEGLALDPELRRWIEFTLSVFRKRG